LNWCCWYDNRFDFDDWCVKASHVSLILRWISIFMLHHMFISLPYLFLFTSFHSLYFIVCWLISIHSFFLFIEIRVHWLILELFLPTHRHCFRHPLAFYVNVTFKLLFILMYFHLGSWLHILGRCILPRMLIFILSLSPSKYEAHL